MKKFLLFGISMMFGTMLTMEAENTMIKNVELQSRYHFAQPISFIERGIEFLIFPDGSFDFNTHFEGNLYGGDMYYRNNTRRASINGTFGAPRTSLGNPVRYSQPNAMAVLIEHDRDGKVRRIGNVFINYDRYGKIKRAGSVYMSYNRGNTGLLTQVGGLKVTYNHWGELVHSYGYVNRLNTGLTYGNSTSSNGSVIFNDSYTNTSNEDFYYYKQNGEVKKKEKLKK